MPYYADKYSTEASNILPGGAAAAALAVGDLVYMNNSGQWALAVSVAHSSSSRTDAIGVIVRTALQYEFVSPVKVAEISGFSGMTIGAKYYLSATGTTGNTITATEPSATVRQQIGFAKSASVIRVDIGGVGADIDVGGDVVVDTLTVTGSSANALVAGPNGTTNPTLKVVTNVTSEATGVSVTGAAAAGGVAIAALSSGNNETLKIDAKGTGNIELAATSSGDVNIGGTNPAFTVDHNASSAATGVKVVAAAAAGGVAIAAISSGTDESMTIDAKGAGTITLNATGTGDITLSRDTNVADGKNLEFSGTTGTKIGSAITQKIGFWNVTPVVQPASGNQAVVTTSVTTTATTTNIKTTVAAIIVLLNQVRSDLVTAGLLKGEA